MDDSRDPRLDPLAAYQAVMQFAGQRGEATLQLARHAALPQVLHANLLHALRLNFAAASFADPAAETDVLFAPFCNELGNGYFEFDRHARIELLSDLDAMNPDETPARSTQVADFVLAYLERERRRGRTEADPLYGGWLEVERWNALAFRDPELAAEQLAQAVRSACAPGDTRAALRLGPLAVSLATPLAGHQRLLAYAVGVQALQADDVERARALLESAGATGMTVGSVELPPAGLLLKRVAAREPFAAAAAPAAPPATSRHRVYISYRRTDSATDAHVIRRELERRLEAGTVFFDRSTIERGDAALESAVRGCDVMLVLIRPRWVGPGLMGEGDVVRRELGLALSLGKKLLPVLLDHASMPPASSLPADLRQLASLNAITIDPGAAADGIAALVAAIARSPLEAAAPGREIFISFAHQDQAWRDRLAARFGPDVRITGDEDIPPGRDWGEEIRRRIARAEAALVLASPNYLASEFRIAHEFPLLRERQRGAGLPLYWVLVRPCRWQGSALAEIPRVALAEGQALDQLAELRCEQALATIVRQLQSPRRGGILISFRTEDGSAAAYRLFETLKREPDLADVEMTVPDVGSSTGGLRAVRERAARCRVLLVVIGRNWFDARDAIGVRHLDRADDIVRLEIWEALAAGAAVVPLLIDGAAMPQEDQLPVGMDGLARRQALSLGSSTWQSDCARLLNVVRGFDVAREPTPPTPDAKRLRVLIASTRDDLADFREAARQMLIDAGHEALAATSLDDRSVESAVDAVGEADLVIFIVAQRYGYVPEASANPRGLSLVELQYERTLEQGRSRLVYLLGGEGKWNSSFVDAIVGDGDKGQRIAGFRKRLLTDPACQAVGSVEDFRDRLMPAVLQMASASLAGAPGGDAAASKSKPPEPAGRVLVFVGHTVDLPGRTPPRFPSSMERQVAEAIRETLARECERGDVAFAIASASLGGDILFLEACADLELPARIFLPQPDRLFVRRALAAAGPQWVERYERLAQRSPVIVLADVGDDAPDTPSRIDERWRRNADAMLDAALAHGAAQATLIALWDGKPTESPGGPTYLLARANTLGVRTVVVELEPPLPA